ncbi:MAG: hypothetical protein KGJ23_04815 [Euryarchaeota archaeon]|nr:hypothetical protein [Euryarchaeota archaeon]MDE1835920.1 hypothetical protein [Euryarchaeota archaeon]MDE1880205.1 hypothetical protein [Euryarchaeota archaeon]MDE2044402.1 hypothetical protein [Thermoplasmata archaeon]
MVCRWCGEKASVNRILRITFCATHGFEGPLDPGDVPVFRAGRALGAGVYPVSAGLATGSWAVPAG